MPGQLRAVVVGAGWAGEGHTRALQAAGVDVVAICARQQDVVRSVADRLGVEEASVDWPRTLENRKPDIVALATPAVLRGSVIEAATDLGCHIFCDKPLATTAQEAGRLYRLVVEAGVKHAYAATICYDPSVAWLAELVQEGAVGPLREIVTTHRRGFSQLAPWSWFMSLAAGGGMLNQALPHFLSVLETITGGKLVRAMGEARVLTDKAPVVSGIHDFRAWSIMASELRSEDLEGLEWRSCDADGAFSALMQFQTAQTDVHVTVILGNGQPVSSEANGVRLYGDAGTLIAEGVTTFSVSRMRPGATEAEALPVPQRVWHEHPDVGDATQNNWCALARDFVADIQGQGHRPYLTFADGWRYQQAIDAIRASTWVDISIDET